MPTSLISWIVLLVYCLAVARVGWVYWEVRNRSLPPRHRPGTPSPAVAGVWDAPGDTDIVALRARSADLASLKQFVIGSEPSASRDEALAALDRLDADELRRLKAFVMSLPARRFSGRR